MTATPSRLLMSSLKQTDELGGSMVRPSFGRTTWSIYIDMRNAGANLSTGHTSDTDALHVESRGNRLGPMVYIYINGARLKDVLSNLYSGLAFSSASIYFNLIVTMISKTLPEVDHFVPVEPST